jgi:putative (di)nucleoside polyphosphate hydrolase
MSDRSHQAIAALVGQLLDDPLVQLVMDADRIDRAEAEKLLRVAALSVEIKDGTLTMAEDETTDFRKGVGVVLFNNAGKIFVAERTDLPGAWQMPQGGIDNGETPEAAALRELGEEIGTDRVRILSESLEWLTYELPPELVGQAWGGRWRGQQQKWFAMLFEGEDSDINIATEHPEFSTWRWASFEEAVALIAPFKRRLYERLADEFAGFAQRASDPNVRERP